MGYHCANCDRTFRSQNAIESHCYAKRHRQIWYCDPCERYFSSESTLEHHETYAKVHRTCTVCSLVFNTVDGYENHCAYSKKHKERLRQPIECHFCDRLFKSPSAYAQHIESGVHRVNRHQVTYAVQSLHVVPTITVATHPGLLGGFANIEAVPDDVSSPFSLATSLDDAEVTQPVEPGPPLSVKETITAQVAPGRIAKYGAPPFAFGTTTYVPGDFIHLGIPYSCHLCFRTFRTVFALTMHMNSAVHDPDAFKCPGKCKKQFKLISALIQHLESGSCGLASTQEIYDRFERLTGNFSRLLKM